MERGHEEVAGPAVAVSREDAARAIGAVRGGREADDQQARLWIAETGHGPSPVRLVPKGAPFVAPDLRAVLAQPCAACTRDDRVAYEAFIESDGRKTGNYTGWGDPVPIYLEGSLFYDTEHRPGVVGPAFARPKTAWEIHPISKILFEPGSDLCAF